MLVFKIKRFAPPKKGCYHREVNFDAPGADMRMARLKLSGECGVIRCLEQLKWVASGAGGGAGSTPRAKGKMSGLSTPRIPYALCAYRMLEREMAWRFISS